MEQLRQLLTDRIKKDCPHIARVHFATEIGGFRVTFFGNRVRRISVFKIFEIQLLVNDMFSPDFSVQSVEQDFENDSFSLHLATTCE